ncbi:MAG TPA: serine/threonine-protein kinase [Bryobacteraceae bacterium]|jgi:non-specific serine/threonine protein kinase|nr:serine/threonine-protein kinase [Bryobacteraceae bacterium]
MIGKMAAHFLILEELGRGSMGIVFKAQDTLRGRIVALKVIAEKLADDPQMLRRFELEGAAASGLLHPNICTVYESGEWLGRPYLSLEYLNGHTLDHHLAQGPLPAATVLNIALGVTRALEATHAIGVIHRDLKPANLFLTNDGQVKVLDFGLAKVRMPERPLGPDAPTAIMYTTSRGLLIGTLPYMSLEQVRCEQLDGRSDLYSLGVVLYELATGDLPVQGGHMIELPLGMGPVVAKLIAVDRAARYQTARGAREAFEECTSGRKAFEHHAL